MLYLSKSLAWAENPKPNAHMAIIQVENSFPAMPPHPIPMLLWDRPSYPYPQGPLEDISPVPTIRGSAKCLARIAAKRVRVSS